MKTFMANPAKIERKWYVVDATGMTLGRLASEVAKILRGKNKPVFTPHEDLSLIHICSPVYFQSSGQCHRGGGGGRQAFHQVG